MSGYSGILISDFYAGYDSVKCGGQQKCWVHLIRDLNNDLWGAPFDTEFEAFVLEVKNLIVPILATIDKNGSQARNLSGFKENVEQFYKKSIDHVYKSDLTRKYQKRFFTVSRQFIYFSRKGWNTLA